MHFLKPKRPALYQSGFTLTELMIVVAILGLIVAIAVPQYRNFSFKAKRAEAVILLSSIHKSQMAHLGATDQFYPKGAWSCGANSIGPQSGIPEINFPGGFTSLGWTHENFSAYGPPDPPCFVPNQSLAYKVDLINEFDGNGVGPDRLRVHYNAPGMSSDTNGYIIQCYDDITNQFVSTCP